MASTRLLLTSLAAGLLGGSTFAQTPAVYPPPPGTAPPGIIPPPPGPSSQALYGGVTAMTAQAPPATTPPPTYSPPNNPPTGLPPATPTGTLTAPPTGLPPGSVASPWVGSRPAGACCGPVGANGPIGYELYVRTGPNLPVGGEDLSAAILTGWTTGGGGRALFFNPAGDRAWVLDLGLSYTYNQGKNSRVLGVFTPTALDQNTNEPTGPDEVNSFGVRGLHRTNFNFAVGRDWFLNGAGNLGMNPAANWRVGGDIGGSWGTSHVDLNPVADTSNYLRKSGVTHGVFLGTHASWEKPMGAYVLFGGLRTQVGYTWTNLVAPVGGDIIDVSFLLTAGVRY